MAFAQLTYQESLRDIEVCFPAQSAKLYHMDLRQGTERSTLTDMPTKRAIGEFKQNSPSS